MLKREARDQYMDKVVIINGLDPVETPIKTGAPAVVHHGHFWLLCLWWESLNFRTVLKLLLLKSLGF